MGKLLNTGRIDELGLLKVGTALFGKANGRSISIDIGPLSFGSLSEACRTLDLPQHVMRSYFRDKRHTELVMLRVYAVAEKQGLKFR